jgi:integrase
MAGKVITREWTSRGPLGRRVRHVAYGYDVTINGKRERKVDSTWTCENDALEELLKRQRDADAGRERVDRTLGELADEYLRYKTDQGKRSLREDRRILKKRILPALGASLPVRRLCVAAIAQYERERAGQVSAYTVANELTVLRHMLRLGRRWGYRDDVPDIAMPKKPAARERYLEETEIEKLLAACGRSRNPYLGPLVALALNTGMRKGELLGLTWERVDLSADFGLSARLTLYKTKSGKPRGIPLNHDAVAALEAVEPAQERRHGPVFKRRNGAEWGQVADGVRYGAAPRRDRGVSVSRPATHVRQPLHDARRRPLRPEGDSRALRREDDRPVRPPEPAPSAHWRGPAEGPGDGAYGT